MRGPTTERICNKKGKICDKLDHWYNGGSACYGRCRASAWRGIKEWPPGSGCETPKTCPFF